MRRPASGWAGSTNRRVNAPRPRNNIARRCSSIPAIRKRSHAWKISRRIRTERLKDPVKDSLLSPKPTLASDTPVNAPLAIPRSSPLLMGETWSLALQALRANKVRAMLTMLGVIIGSACIVLVVTVALSGKRYIIGQIEGVGANLVHASVIHSGGAVTVADEVT